MLTKTARKYPLHYKKVRELYAKGVTEGAICMRLRVTPLDVEDWTNDLRDSKGPVIPRPRRQKKVVRIRRKR